MHVVFFPDLSWDLANDFQVELFPHPGGPIRNTECLISSNYESWTIFNINYGWGYNPFSLITV